MAKQKLVSGTRISISGQYEMINTNGKRTGIERTVTKGEPLPPTLKKGYRYRLADKTHH